MCDLAMKQGYSVDLEALKRGIDMEPSPWDSSPPAISGTTQGTPAFDGSFQDCQTFAAAQAGNTSLLLSPCSPGPHRMHC